VVEEVGKHVRNFRLGDRVVIGSTITCGYCAYCRAGYLGYQPLWTALAPSAARKLQRGNYERLFDEARAGVRTSEQAHSGEDIWDY